MTTTATERTLELRRRACADAVRAPSVHNTQPWQIGVRENGLDLFADRGRQLAVLDPTGRQLMLSLGCALLNARVAYAAGGVHAVVDRFPDHAGDGELVVTVHEGDSELDADDRQLAALEPLVDLRHSNRREFGGEQIPAELSDTLIAAAIAEGSHLVPILTDDHRLAVARLVQAADKQENGNAAYRAEIRQWTSNEPTRRDGLSQLVVPHVAGDAEDEIPIRDFDTYGIGWLPSHTHSSRHQTLFLLGTDEDDDAAWLRAGEALERILLEVTRAGFAASLFTQPIEVVTTREQLRMELGLRMHPHVLLRIGRAPATPSTARRPLGEVTFTTDEPPYGGRP